MYTVTNREIERAAIALFSANLDKDCEFTIRLKHLFAQQRVQEHMSNQGFRGGKLPIDQAN